MRKSLRVGPSQSARHLRATLAQLLTLVASLAFATPLLAQARQPPSSAEGEEQARAHFRLGRAYYENGDFSKAAVEFEAAFKISQRPGLLYNIYLAYRDASDVPHAAEALRKYLELEKNVENRGQLTARLAAMDRALAEEAAQANQAQQQAAQPEPKSKSALAPAQPSAPQSAAVPPPAASAPSERPQPMAAEEPVLPAGTVAASAQPEEHDGGPRLWPIVLMAGGGVLVASSVITGVLALGKRGELSDAQNECTRVGNCSSLPAVRLRQLEDTRKSGTTLATVTDVLLFGGIAVAAAGAAWFVLSPRSDERASASATQAGLACVPGSCAARISLRF